MVRLAFGSAPLDRTGSHFTLVGVQLSATPPNPHAGTSRGAVSRSAVGSARQKGGRRRSPRGGRGSLEGVATSPASEARSARMKPRFRTNEACSFARGDLIAETLTAHAEVRAARVDAGRARSVARLAIARPALGGAASWPVGGGASAGRARARLVSAFASFEVWRGRLVRGRARFARAVSWLVRGVASAGRAQARLVGAFASLELWGGSLVRGRARFARAVSWLVRGVASAGRAQARLVGASASLEIWRGRLVRGRARFARAVSWLVRGRASAVPVASEARRRARFA